MSDLLKEFEDDLKRERNEKRWKNFGKQMVGISIAVVLGTMGAVAWKSYKESRAASQTSILMQGEARLEAEDYKGAVDLFSQVADKSGEQYGFAMLKKAQAQLKQGDEAAAQKTYEALASSGGSKDAFSSLAKLLSAQHSGILPEPAKDAPFYYAHMELRAWQLLKQDKKEDAVKVFASLQDDPKTPVSVRGRTAEALQLLAPETLLPDAKAENKE